MLRATSHSAPLENRADKDTRPLGVPDSAVPGISVTLGLVLATIATMIFGELVPKKLGIAVPFPIARRTQGLIREALQPEHPRQEYGDLEAKVHAESDDISQADDVPSEIASGPLRQQLLQLAPRTLC